jgi:hypothetical protein
MATLKASPASIEVLSSGTGCSNGNRSVAAAFLLPEGLEVGDGIGYEALDLEDCTLYVSQGESSSVHVGAIIKNKSIIGTSTLLAY